MAAKKRKALVALGANLPSDAGLPSATLRKALGALAKTGVPIRAVSRFFATPCFPPGAGPDYVNAAACLDWSGTPEDLLARLHEVETAFARTRDKRWGQRTLDLDLLTLDDAILPDATVHADWRNLPLEAQMQVAPDQLILPHPRLQERAFVLVPLADIAPSWRHPILGTTVADMLASLPKALKEEVVAL